MTYDTILDSCDVNHPNDIVGFGRYSNADYLTFLSVLSAAQKSLTQQNKVFVVQRHVLNVPCTECSFIT